MLLASSCITGSGWAATVNGFNASLDNGLLRLNLSTDQPVTPKIQKAAPLFNGASESETTVFIPGATLAADLTQNGPPTVLDTRGRFSAQAKATSAGVMITLSNLQDKAFQLSVSQHQGKGLGQPAGFYRLPEKFNSQSVLPITEIGNRPGAGKQVLGLHLVSAPPEPASSSSSHPRPRSSILGQAPVVPLEQLPSAGAWNSTSTGLWPFASAGQSTPGSVTHSYGHTEGAEVTGNSVPPDMGTPSPMASRMSPVGLLPPRPSADILSALPAEKSASTASTVQEVSIKPMLNELPIWLLPLLGFFLGGVGLLALTVTLVLVGGALRHWPRRIKIALQAMAKPAKPFPVSPAEAGIDTTTSMELNVSHASPKPSPPSVKSAYAQAPVLNLNTTVRVIAPPLPTQTVEEAIQRTHGRSYGNRRRHLPMESDANRGFALHKRRVTMGLT